MKDRRIAWYDSLEFFTVFKFKSNKLNSDGQLRLLYSRARILQTADLVTLGRTQHAM